MHSNPGDQEEYRHEETEADGYVPPEDEEIEVIEIPGEDDEEWEVIEEDPEVPEEEYEEEEYEYEEEPEQQ